jgi:hypothetical protein
VIETLGERDDTVFMNGGEVLDWYLSASVER